MGSDADDAPLATWPARPRKRSPRMLVLRVRLSLAQSRIQQLQRELHWEFGTTDLEPMHAEYERLLREVDELRAALGEGP